MGLNLESNHHLDSSILWDFWLMLTKRNSTVSVTLNLSTDVSPNLPSLVTSSPVLVFTFQETLTTLEPALTPSPMVGPPSVQSQVLDLPKSSFSLDSLNLE